MVKVSRPPSRITETLLFSLGSQKRPYFQIDMRNIGPLDSKRSTLGWLRLDSDFVFPSETDTFGLVVLEAVATCPQCAMKIAPEEKTDVDTEHLECSRRHENSRR